MTTTFLSTVKPPSRAGSLLQATAVVRAIREQSHQADGVRLPGQRILFHEDQERLSR